MMMRDENTSADGLVPSPNRQLTRRSVGLIRRALDDIARMAPIPEQARGDLAGAGPRLAGFSGIASRSTRWHAARGKLLPYLLPLDGPDIGSDAEAFESHVVAREADPSAGLTVALVQNEAQRVLYVTGGHLESWGVSEQEAWAAAYANLDTHLEDIIMELSATGMIHVLGWEPPLEVDFAATLLLSRAFRTMLCATLDTEFCIVGIPCRNHLLAMASDFDGIDEAVHYFPHEALLYPKGISGESFVVHRSGAWEHIVPPDGFVRLLGRPLATSELDDPYMGLPDFWSLVSEGLVEPFVRYYSDVWSIQHPASWRVETHGRITSLIPPWSGSITISSFRKDAQANPVLVHEACDVILGLTEELGHQMVLYPRVRRMRGWTGVYAECTSEEPESEDLLELAAFRGHALVFLTANASDMTWAKKDECLHVLYSLEFHHE